MTKDPKEVFTETIRRYIDANAGMFAGEAEAYIPGIVETLLAALAAHNLEIVDRPRPVGLMKE